MAYIRASATYGATGQVASSVHDMTAEMIRLDSEIDDIIVLVVAINGARTVSSLSTANWTNAYERSANSLCLSVWWKRATVANEDMPIVTINSADGLSAVALSIQGCTKTGNPIINSANKSASSNNLQFPAITGCTQHSFVVYGGAAYETTLLTGQQYWKENADFIDNAYNTGANDVTAAVFTRYVEDNRDLDAYNHRIQNTKRAHTVALEFEDANDPHPRIPVWTNQGEGAHTALSGRSNNSPSSSVWKEWLISGTKTLMGETKQEYTFTNSEVSDNSGVINVTPSGGLLDDTQRRCFKFTVVSGTAPGNLTDGQFLFLATDGQGGSAFAVRNASGNGKFVNLSNISYVDSGSGTFKLVEMGAVSTSVSTSDDVHSLTRQTSGGHQMVRTCYGTFIEYTSMDFTTRNSSIAVRARVQHGGANVVIMIIADSNGNWRSYSLGDGFKAVPYTYKYVNPASDKFLGESTTSPDLTDVTYIGMFYLMATFNARPQIQWDGIYLMGRTQVKGGDAIEPMSFKRIIERLNAKEDYFGTLASDVQTVTRPSIEIGDNGSHSVYFSDTSKSLAFNAIANGVDQFDFYPANMAVDFNLGATDYVSLTNSVIAASEPMKIELLGNSSATLNWAGNTFVNADGKFRSTDTVDSVLFTGGTGLVDHNNATITNCRFSDLGRPAGNILLDPSHKISSSEIRNTNSTHYALEIPSAGTYLLDDITMIGFGTSNTNATLGVGTAILQVQNGTTTPTLDSTWTDNGDGTFSKGSATVEIQQNTILTIENLKVNSEIRIYQAGTTTEVAGIENTTSSSHSFTIGVSSVDVVVHSLGFQYLRLSNVNTSVNTAFPVSQQVDRQYENP